MTDITIPPEALEAAARAIAQNDGCPLDLFPVCHNEYVGCDCRNEARAACLAMLRAWPGMVINPSFTGIVINPSFTMLPFGKVHPAKLILPLTQEASDGNL